MSGGMRRNHLIWLGPSITAGGTLSYFMFFYRFPALRDFPWINLPLVLAGLSLSAIALWRAFARPRLYRGKVLGSAGLVVSLAVAALFASYVFVLSYRLPAPTPETRGRGLRCRRGSAAGHFR